jgi:transcriptional regulator with XRE-family HTH domain
MVDRGYQRLLIAAIDAEMGVRRLSRARLAKMAGIPTVSMDRYFNLGRDMNVSQLGAIADALGVTPEYLVGKAAEYRGNLPPTTGRADQDAALRVIADETT